MWCSLIARYLIRPFRLYMCQANVVGDKNSIASPQEKAIRQNFYKYFVGTRYSEYLVGTWGQNAPQDVY